MKNIGAGLAVLGMWIGFSILSFSPSFEKMSVNTPYGAAGPFGVLLLATLIVAVVLAEKD